MKKRGKLVVSFRVFVLLSFNQDFDYNPKYPSITMIRSDYFVKIVLKNSLKIFVEILFGF